MFPFSIRRKLWRTESIRLTNRSLDGHFRFSFSVSVLAPAVAARTNLTYNLLPGCIWCCTSVSHTHTHTYTKPVQSNVIFAEVLGFEPVLPPQKRGFIKLIQAVRISVLLHLDAAGSVTWIPFIETAGEVINYHCTKQITKCKPCCWLSKGSVGIDTTEIFSDW